MTTDLTTQRMQIDVAWLLHRDETPVYALAADYPDRAEALFEHFIDLLLYELAAEPPARPAEAQRLRQSLGRALLEAGYDELARYFQAT